jgi:NTP pyrophosphatase (non-canonical NTP hydrolase)
LKKKDGLDEVWKEIIYFNEKYFPDWRNSQEIYYSNAIAGEAGEVCNTVKHRTGGGTNKSYPDNYDLLIELADLFIYIELLVEKLHVDNTLFAGIIRDKIEVNIKRMEEATKK